MYLKITHFKQRFLLVLLLAVGSMSAQTTVTRVITDWNGYWSSIATSANAAQQPDDRHNLVGFQVGSTVYSTGVNDGLLTTNGITFSPGSYKALPISGISGNAGASAYIVLGKKIDGNINAANYLSPAVDNLTLLDVMIDGANGLDLGTGSTNISTGAVLNFSISGVVESRISDAEPDILITQIADPSSGTNDTFSFRDINGNVVGNAIVVSFNSITAIGTYKMDLFTLADGQPYATVTPSANGSAGTGTRDIRIVSLRLSDFGINSGNYANIASFRFSPGGASDPAFIAYNANAFLIPAPEIIQQPTSQVACPGVGNNATFNVVATGEGLTYQWRKNGVNISGATSDSYTISNVQASDVGAYNVIITNAAGSVVSNTVYLNTVAAVQPVNTTTCQNTTADISFTANGLSVTYQWYSNTSLSNTGGTLIPGATSSTYNPPVNTAGTFYYYSVATSDNENCTALPSSAVSFTVSPTSVAGTAAISHTICAGSTTQLTLSGHTGTIQWQQSVNGTSGWVNVTGGSGATTVTYTTPVLNATMYYRARVTSGVCSTATTNTVTVTITDTNNWTGAVNTAWNTPGNWECGVVPTLLLNANIPVVVSGNYPVIDGADGIASCKDITVADGASVTISGDGEGTLQIAGTITNAGVMDATDGTVAMLGTSAQVIPADTFETNTLRNLTINNAFGITLGGATDLTGILTLTSGQLNTGNALTLKSNAATTAMIAPVLGSVTGTMTIERYIPSRRAFRFISSPVNGGSINANWQEGSANSAGWGTDITGAGAPLNGFDESGSNNPSMFTYDNVARTWNAVTNTLTTNLAAGTPYRLMVRGDRTIDQFQNESEPTNTTLRSTGTIVTGNVVVNSFSEDAGDLNFVGNPYQAPIDMGQVLNAASNINPTFYTVWDPTLGGAPVVGVAGGRGAYVTVDLLEGDNSNPESVANQFLQPNQACFVQTLSGGPASLTFREEYKDLLTNDTPLLYRNANNTSAKIKLQLYDSNSFNLGETSADGLTIRFSDEYSDEVDTMDALKMTNQDENVAVLNSNKRLSIERRSMPEVSDVIQLFNSQYRKTDYTYSIQVEALDNVTAYLVDNYTEEVTELDNNDETTYSFTVNSNDAASIDTGRFMIVFGENALGGDDFVLNGFSMYPNPSAGGEFFIKLPSGTEGTEVAVYNTIGQKVASTVAMQSGNTLVVKPAVAMSTGIYMVQVTNAGRTITKKLIIK
jgi:hypothetical protein